MRVMVVVLGDVVVEDLDVDGGLFGEVLLCTACPATSDSTVQEDDEAPRAVSSHVVTGQSLPDWLGTLG